MLQDVEICRPYRLHPVSVWWCPLTSGWPTLPGASKVLMIMAVEIWRITWDMARLDVKVALASLETLEAVELELEQVGLLLIERGIERIIRLSRIRIRLMIYLIYDLSIIRILLIIHRCISTLETILSGLASSAMAIAMVMVMVMVIVAVMVVVITIQVTAPTLAPTLPTLRGRTKEDVVLRIDHIKSITTINTINTTGQHLHLPTQVSHYLETGAYSLPYETKTASMRNTRVRG
jgi:hypothetical protein